MREERKIVIKNIYYMLAYAFSDLNWSDYESIVKEEFENIHNLFAEILILGIAKQLKQGLYREYTSKLEDLSTIRGKIEISGTMKNRMARKYFISCKFDDLSENNPLNQIIKTTVGLLLQSKEVSRKRKDKLKKEMLFFSQVDMISPKAIRWSRINFCRNNRSYQTLIRICQFLLESMLLTTEKGEYKLARVLDKREMSSLFQAFVFAFYKKEFPELKVFAPRMEWMVDDDNTAMLPGMQTDIVLEKDEKILMIDTKYYEKNLQEHHGKSTVISAHLYQIFSYVKNMEAKKKKEAREKYGKELNSDSTQISGLLLYAKTEEASQPDGQYKIMGNAIGVRTVNLNQDFAGIKRELGEVVKVGGFMNYDDK